MLFKGGQIPINGGEDSFVVKRKHIKGFTQVDFYEKIEISVPYVMSSPPVWFHFMKSLRSNGLIRKNEEAQEEEIGYLNSEQKELFELNIRPLLKNSPYAHVRIPTLK